MRQSKFPENDKEYQNATLAKVQLSPEHAKQVWAWVDQPKDVFVYCGSPGCGKTYFCAALVNYLKEKNKSYFLIFERDFFSQLREIIELNWDPIKELDKFAEIPFVLFDDMANARNGQLNDWQKEMLFNFLDIRVMSRLPTVITSNLFLKDYKKEFEGRFYSRLAAKRNSILQLRSDDLRQEYA